MAKQSKNVNFAGIFQSINSDISSLLKKSKNGKDLNSLTEDEREKFWSVFLDTLKQNNLENLSEENVNNLKICTELILKILDSRLFDFDNNEKIYDIIEYLNSSVKFEEQVLINSVSKMNEYWMVKMQNPKEIRGMDYLTVKHLLTICTIENPLVSDIQRLSAISKVITSDPFDKAVPSLRPLLLKLVCSLPVIETEYGQKFVAKCLILSQKIMTEIQKVVMSDLRSCIKKKCEFYAVIYIIAWHSASDEMKELLVRICIRKIMGAFLREHRTSLELSKISQNLLVVLEAWHSERKKKNPDFVTMITDAYQPLLWKYLQSGYNVHRCNATDLFFKAFPLHRTTSSGAEAEKFFIYQIHNMLMCLSDECHIVRIISVREVCNILSHYWNTFKSKQINDLMSVITKRCARDASSADIRKMVYIGFQSLVKSRFSSDYAKKVLIQLSHGLHDVNQKVRVAFVQLLICIKQKKDPDFKYIDVVSMSELQYRLGIDNIAVGHWIVKLIIKNYYHSKLLVNEWFKRFIYLITKYRSSYRNFFFYSSKSLPFSDACTIIYEILSKLGNYVISKSSVDQENNENESENTSERTKNQNKMSVSHQNQNATDATEVSGPKKCIFEDPDIVFALFDIVTILWVLHDSKLQKPENEEIRFKLYDTYIKYAQPFINYYKNSDLLYGIIGFSGNIPASLLRCHSITLPGYCMKTLKSIKMESTDEEHDKMNAILVALVKWGRGSEILEQVTLWLEAAFETQNMNETILPRKRVKINETIQPNSIVAIYILDSLLKKEYVKLSILKKNYQELFQLWNLMSKVRQLIKARFEQGEPFEEDLVSDQFIKLCFRRYVKLILLLKENEVREKEKGNVNGSVEEGFINYENAMEEVLKWAEDFLYPFLLQEELSKTDVDLVISFLEDIIYVSDNMIIVHLVAETFQFKVGHFVLKLLDTKYGIRFINPCSRIVSALSFSNKVLYDVKDNFNIFSTLIPSLLSRCLNILSSDLSEVEFEKIDKDLPNIRTHFGKILITYQDNVRSKSNVVENARHLKLVVGLFVDAVVSILCKEISRPDFSVPMYSSMRELPAIAYFLLVLFSNRKIWNTLFLHVMTTKLATYDIKSILACIHLIYLYAKTDKKMNRVNIKNSLSMANTLLTKFKGAISNNKDGSVNLTMNTETEERNTLASDAATKASVSSGTGLLSIPTESEERVIKKMAVSNQDDGNSSTSEKSNSVLSTHSEENSDLVLIKYGYDLIKIVEYLLKDQVESSEDSSSGEHED